jgi:hypothetical protein
MKKFKRFLAAITTVAVSAVSFCSMFTASADTTQLKTFRIFHEVAVNSNIAYFDYTINYSSIVTATPSIKTNLLDNGYFTSTNNGKVQATYLGNSINTNGIIATTDFYTPMSVTSIFNEISYNATIRNSNNNNIDPNSITMTSVLMGDVNQDGIVNKADVEALNKYLLNSDDYPLLEKELLAANVSFDFDQNGNPIIDKIDLSYLIEYTNGGVKHF